MRLLARLRDIDRRIMYLLLIAVIVVPLLTNKIRQPLYIGRDVQGVYNAVQHVPKGKIAIVSIVWGAGTLGENRPQTQAIVRHLFRENVPFVLLSWDQQGTTLARGVVEELAASMHKEYGKNWINLGYRPPYIVQFLQSLGGNVPRTMGKDYRGRPVSVFPMMKGIDNGNDIGLVAEVTPSATVDVWIAFIGQQYRVPIVYAPTAVMAPEGYNYLDAGQIAGMLPGLIGAAEYDQMLGEKTFATRAANSLSTSHLLIILLIILGNLGYLASRRLQRQ